MFAVAVVLVMAGVCPIVAYRPKRRREEELLRLVRARVRTLRREGRANERVPVIPRAKDGTIRMGTFPIRAFVRLTTE